MSDDDSHYDRQTLYDEVWAQPVYKVAKRYGISNVALAKTCRKMHIPLPGKGYWNKVHSGRQPGKEVLPEYPHCPVIRKSFPGFDADAPPQEIVRLVPEAFAREERLIVQEQLPGMQLAWDPGVRLTNPFILNTKKKLEASARRINGQYDFGRCTSDCDEAFSLQIGPASIPRATAILQTLCDALENRGYPVGIEPGQGGNEGPSVHGCPERDIRPVCAKVVDTCIFFRITETSHKRIAAESERKATYQDYEYVPTGKLCFEILNHPSHNHGRNTWHDGKTAKIEDQINDIIVNMIRISTSTKESGAWAEVENKKRAIEAAARRERELQMRRNKIRLERLDKQTDHLLRYQQTSEYVRIMTAEGQRRLGDAYPGSDFSNWVQWAQTLLRDTGPETWELPKFEVPDDRWAAPMPLMTF